jgi:DNA-binding SARP family transcriptional activator
MHFQVLGPVRVTMAGTEIAVTAARDRTMLAMLLLHANQPVPVDRLVDAIWAGPSVPRHARTQLQGCVHRLRRQLAGDTGTGTGPVIVTEPGGYRLTVDPASFDLLEFRRLLAEARAHAGDPDPGQAIRRYRAALRLWRGPALAGVDSRLVRDAATALDEERTRAQEECLAAELAAGAGGELIAEITELVHQHPLREGLHQALMLALYRAGRLADALAAYRRARQLLHDELGTDPGSELQRLHQAILNRSPEIGPAPPATRPAPPPPVPRELPAEVPGFIGRVDALRALHQLLPGGGAAPGPVAIAAITGTAGVGKTALAVHWAHRVAGEFPDGQLYVNLGGFDPDRPPVAPAEALRGFLDALRVPPRRIPAGLDAQAALYRSLLAGRRMLVVLDNARDPSQIRPLLPGSGGSVVLVTSRSRLLSLVSAVGARPLALELLPPAEARQLLVHRLSAARVAAEPAAVDQLIDGCAGLPLALAIVAARAAVDPDLRINELAAELRQARHRLDALSDPDPVADVRSALDVSYRTLSGPAARLFRLLGLHPGPDFSAPAAASLLAGDPAAVRPPLAELARANLVEEPAPGRFRFHDLLRAYAAELARLHEPEQLRQRAIRRMLDFYLHSAEAAARALSPHRPRLRLPAAPAGVVPEQPEDHQAALAWFTGELPVLLAAVDRAVALGLDQPAWQLAWTSGTFLQRQARYQEWADAQRTALEAARRLGDLAAQATTHRSYANARSAQGSYDDAHTHLRLALDLFERLDDRIGQGLTLFHIGKLLDRQGRQKEALCYAHRALTLFQESRDRYGQALAQNAIGWLHTQLGNHQQALDHCQQALELQQQLDDRIGQAATWDSLGHAHHCLGHHQAATNCYRRALELIRASVARYQEADVLSRLGDAHHAAGELTAAGEAWRAAMRILQEIEHPEAEQVRAKLRRHLPDLDLPGRPAAGS